MSQDDWGSWKPGNSRAGNKAIDGAWLASGFKKQKVEMPQVESKTLDLVVKIIEEELSKGSARAKFVKRIKSELGLDEDMADIFANFGSSLATEESNLNDYLESSVEQITWLGGGCCEVCDKNDGEVVSISKRFPSGHYLPPACAFCSCTISPHIVY